MRDLLAALLDDPRIRWRSRGLVTLIGGLSLASAWGLWQASEREPGPATCSGAREHLEGVWDDARRDALAQAMLASPLPYAASIWDHTAPLLDSYADAWVAMHTDACVATRVRGEQSEADMSMRMDCLHERQLHLRAAVDELETADTAAVRGAVEAVSKLPSIERCSDLAALRAEQPPPDDPQVAREVERLDERVVAATAKLDASRVHEAEPIIDEVVALAGAIDYPPLRVRAWLAQGAVRDREGDYEGSLAAYRSAYDLALAQGLTAEASRAASSMRCGLGVRVMRSSEAHTWAIHADPLSRAAGSDDLRAMFLNSQGALLMHEGHYDAARGYFERALVLRERSLGSEHLLVAKVLNNLGIVAAWQGKYDEGLAFLERSLSIREALLGPEHPDVAMGLNNLANLALSSGQRRRAERLATRALTLETRNDPQGISITFALGTLADVSLELGDYAVTRDLIERKLAIQATQLDADHPDYLGSRMQLARVLTRLGEAERARDMLRADLPVSERVLGVDNPELAYQLLALGVVERELGDAEAAHDAFTRALALREPLGPRHPDLAYPLFELGDLALAQASDEEARHLHARALDILTSSLRPEHPDLAYPLTGLAEAELALGRPERALALLERALVLRSEEVAPALRERSRRAHARADAARLARAQ